MFSSETYSIRDVHYYADESKIISSWTATTSVSGRTIYITPIDIGINDSFTLEVKYNSVPSVTGLTSVVQVGLYSNVNQLDVKCGLLANNNKMTPYYSSSSYNRNKLGTSTDSIDVNSVYKVIVTNGTTGNWYKDDVQFASYSLERTGSPSLRYDLFDSDTAHIDYIIVV